MSGHCRPIDNSGFYYHRICHTTEYFKNTKERQRERDRQTERQTDIELEQWVSLYLFCATLNSVCVNLPYSQLNKPIQMVAGLKWSKVHPTQNWLCQWYDGYFVDFHLHARHVCILKVVSLDMSVSFVVSLDMSVSFVVSLDMSVSFVVSLDVCISLCVFVCLLAFYFLSTNGRTTFIDLTWILLFHRCVWACVCMCVCVCVCARARECSVCVCVVCVVCV